MKLPKKLKIELADETYQGSVEACLQRLIWEGVEISRNVAEDAIAYSPDPLEAMLEVERRFKLWREAIKRFAENSKIDSPVVSYFYQNDKVPYLKGGIEYGDINSKKSKLLIKNIQKATNQKLEKLRSLQVSLFTKISKPAIQQVDMSLPTIYFDINSGIGYTNEKRFKLKNNQVDFRVFGELFKRVKRPLSREKILKLGNCTTTSTTLQTSYINELAKRIRKKVKLNTEFLVLNNGSITLRAIKLKNAPN